jgi:hypothetical protein
VKIWQKEVAGPFLISGKWLGAYLELFFKLLGSEYENLYRGLIFKKYRGLLQSGEDYSIFVLFSNGKRHGLGPRWTLDRGRR